MLLFLIPNILAKFTRKFCVKSLPAIVVLMFLVVPFLPVQAIEYGGFGGRPAYPRTDNPSTESIFIHTLEPGAVQQEGVQVINNTASQKTVMVYAADSTPSTGGGFACRQFVESKDDVGGWIALEKSELTLEPGTNEMIPFTITVPQTAGVGEHNGCILIQEKKASIEGQSGASISVRTGMRVAITIPGEIIRKLEIVGFDVVPGATGFSLMSKVKNSGNVSTDANISVVTSYFFGTVLGTNDAKNTVLRGETADWNFEREKPFWGGWYYSNLVVEYDEAPGSEVKDGVKSDAMIVRLEGTPVWFFSWPTLTALIIEVVILLAFILIILLLCLSHGRKRWIKKTWVSYKIQSGNTINSLADRFDVSWKLLARVNKLKPPYALKAGGIISVPGKSVSGKAVPKKSVARKAVSGKSVKSKSVPRKVIVRNKKKFTKKRAK